MHFGLFDRDIYVQRRLELKRAVGSGLLLLLGNEETGMNYRDNCYPFRQDSSFLYYFGLDLAGLAAVLDADSGEEILLGDDPGMDEIIWTGTVPTMEEMAFAVGVKQTRPYRQVEVMVREALAAGRRIHFLPPYRNANLLKLSAWLQQPVSAVREMHSLDLVKAVINQRAYKQACEVDAIERAVSISADMHLTAMQLAVKGMKEYELAARVQEVAHAAGGRLSYPVILTVNGQTLHNHYYGNTLQDGNILLVDAGAEEPMHYAGDLTRSFPVSRHFSTPQREIYEVVLAALEKASSLLRPGIPFMDVHARASEQLLVGLKNIGLFKGDPAEGVEAGAHTLFFQCGLGHMMGLDVHDMEDLGEQYVGYTDSLPKRTDFGWKSLRLGRPLEPGFVLTVEPGIYMIPELMDRWKAERKLESFIDYRKLEEYRHFGGIRIEDNFLITPDGARRLGKYLPTKAREVEAVRESCLA